MSGKNNNYSYLIPLAMLYITFDLSSLVYSYKEIKISFIIGMASSIMFPITYIITDIVTEVYGYKSAKSLIWYGIICDFIFSVVTYIVSFTPSPSINQYNAYQTVMGPLLRAISAQTLGIIAGGFVNIYLLSKWKIILKGKYFWLRSICSTTIGEGLTLVISVFVALQGIVKLDTILHVILYAYLYKIAFAIFIAPFASLVAKVIRMKEGINIYDYNIKLDPFKNVHSS
jgi:uncharacterized integral membrane protein (TIGR00697 family)